MFCLLLNGMSGRGGKKIDLCRYRDFVCADFKNRFVSPESILRHHIHVRENAGERTEVENGGRKEATRNNACAHKF